MRGHFRFAIEAATILNLYLNLSSLKITIRGSSKSSSRISKVDLGAISNLLLATDPHFLAHARSLRKGSICYASSVGIAYEHRRDKSEAFVTVFRGNRHRRISLIVTEFGCELFFL